MQVDPKLNSNPITKVTPVTSTAAKPAPVAASDSAEFQQAEALNQKLAEEPETRAAEVERALNLLGQVQWPPAETIRRIASLLAVHHLGSLNE